MKNDTCVICGKTFEPREKKLYCSDTCKQYAFNKRKQDSEVKPDQEPETSEPGKPIYEFSLKEFKEFSALSKRSDIDLFKYMFIRKNLSGLPSVEEICEYFTNFNKDDDFLYFINDTNNKIGKAFESFNELFAKGLIKLST